MAVLVEGFGIPTPGQTLLVAGAVLAAQGQLDIVLVAALSYVAAIIGDNTGYVIGRFGGRQLVLSRGRFIGLRERHLDRVEAFVHRYGSGILCFARFIDVLRQTVSLASGLGRLPWLRFAIFDAIGCALWVGVWSTIAYLFGQHLDAILTAARKHPLYMIGAGVLIVLIIGGVIVYRLRGRLFGGNDE